MRNTVTHFSKEVNRLSTDEVADRLHSLAIHLLRRVSAVDRETGISGERLSLLSVVVFGGARTITGLARIEGVSRPAISRSVAGLEAAGLVRRQPSPTDQRAVVVEATAAGRRVMERGRARRVAVVAEILGGLSRREQQAIDRATEALAAALQR